MKAFNRLILVFILIAAVIFAAVNLLYRSPDASTGRQYRVDAARAASVIAAEGIDALVLSDYPTLTAVVPVSPDDIAALEGGREDYLLRSINGRLYRFDYSASGDARYSAPAAVNISLGVMTAAVLGLLLYVRQKIIRPFFLLSEMPYELSRGNLTAPVTQGKQRYFGRFLWGMDMLRENLEQQRQTELALHSERKKLILSLSHDIRIPLSAIRLYSKALSRNLYEDREKQTEIALKIDEKACEIEEYVSRIVTASREDFLSLEVNSGEHYLSEILDSVRDYYTEKLELLHISFTMGDYINCLLRCDLDRSVEVLQNMVENAIKYGDGGSIGISVSSEENCRLVTVTNTGCTLPRSELPHLFDSFWRGSNAADTSGSGLGLYICRSLMNKMGGEVFARIEDGTMSVTAVFALA